MRQLILCFDGTNNNFTGGMADTSVVKLRELLAAQVDAEQLVYYDPGVGNAGTLPEATLGAKLRGIGERVAGLAFGRGVFEDIDDGYRFLMREYQRGDEIYIFGFSRGAFTARSVAGLVNMFGILRPEAEPMVSTLIHLYFADSGKAKDNDPDQARPEHLSAQIRRSFGQGQMPIHFVGVWDTVASVGMWPFGLRITAKPTLKGKHFIHVRQALALDEMRAQFMPRLYAQDNGEFPCAEGFGTGTLVQLWYRGSHCDVGGGYAHRDATLSRTPLEWMVDEARAVGLRLSPVPPDPHLPPPRIHNQLWCTPMWAVTGMALRTTDRVILDDCVDPHIKPVESPSVAAWPAEFPRSTVWAHWQKLGTADFVMLILLLFCPWAMAHMSTHEGMHEFIAWQLAWWRHSVPVMWPETSQVMWQLLLDLPFILAWAWWLSYFAVRAFARRAGLQRVHSPRPQWLLTLGWSLTVAVFGDLAEDALTVVVLAFLSYGHSTLATAAAFCMSFASGVKYLGLLGALILIVSGLLPARKS
ncbi:MAG TPA: DUF2235 domain-containing protein [Burkholderiaceae bacterium]|jgi:uncharacterized protein (DUF2235 family)